jgi:2-polyprenyl-3-methyl-5-hydroxy-6-metoxy-1,4-benzoquinol methylase
MKSLASIYPVMERYGVTCTPDEFQRTVNLVFHRSESRVYDAVHRDMWTSLPQQFNLLVSDYLGREGMPGSNLALLDVGCGTGLASELLLKTQFGERITEIDLLDTATEMLQKARERVSGWGLKTNVIDGTLDKISGRTRKYDVIVISSVLHHIPDLTEFLSHVRKAQAPRGILMHLQDPNGDFLSDPVLRERTAELGVYERPVYPKWLTRLTPSRIIGRLRRGITGRTDADQDYIGRVNDELVQAGVIRKPMAPRDIWSVTDIHVHDGKGVSIEELRGLLAGYRMIATRSYSFFGKMCSELPESFKKREQELIEAKAPNGLEVAGIWKLND